MTVQVPITDDQAMISGGLGFALGDRPDTTAVAWSGDGVDAVVQAVRGQVRIAALVRDSRLVEGR